MLYRRFYFSQRFKSGNERTFNRVYKRFEKPIYRFVSSRINDPAAAEEVTQEVFLKAYRFREGYDPKFAFSTWLWTIARNSVSDWLRKSRPYLEATADNEIDVACPEANAETMTARKSDRRYLLRLMGSLTRLQKRVLWMRIVHQLSYPEISAKLGLSLSSVKNLAYRAKITLTATLGHEPSLA